jgi:hypothetical protein
MGEPQNIYLDSFYEEYRAEVNELNRLSFFSKKYKLVDNPENADIILICYAPKDNYSMILKNNPLVKKYLSKSFVFTNADRPMQIIRGIYTSAEKNFINFSRVKSCSYTADYKKFVNPFISSYKYLPHDFEPKYLFSFLGRNSHDVRNVIFNINFKRKDIFIHDSSEFNLFTHDEDVNKLEFQKKFCDILLQSKFSLCPRGFGANSFRLFESMQLGIAPIIISDDWILPNGPDWRKFSIIIKEKDIKNLEVIVQEYENNYKQMGESAREAFLKYFDDKVFFDYVVDNCSAIMRNQIFPEIYHFYFSLCYQFIFSKFKSFKNRLVNLLRLSDKCNFYKQMAKCF